MTGKVFSIMIALGVLFQSLLGGIAGADTICLGGGHTHPQDDAVTSCELDCNHAAGLAIIPSPVQDIHSDCQCIDIELSLNDLLSTLPRIESQVTQDALLLPLACLPISLADRGLSPCPSFVPKWFDPGGTRRINDIATTRLIV